MVKNTPPDTTRVTLFEKQPVVGWLRLRVITVQNEGTYVPKTRANEHGGIEIKNLAE
jgi:hypothetical protein